MRIKKIKMRFLSPVVAVSICLVVSFVLWGGPDGGGHDFRGRCETCHLSIPKAGETVRFTRDISYLCLDCHTGASVNSHPIGMVASMTVPEGFLLDWSGRMTCATCHDPHADNPDDDQGFMRTDARGRDFCSLCHQSGLPLSGAVHAGAGSVAHGKSGIVELNEEYSQILDSVTMECLGCHDGTIASDASYQLKGGDALTYQRDGRSHPIGMDYEQAAMQDSELRPVSMLSPDIVFYDGKVGCVSCHNPYSRIRRMLVVDDMGSKLCFECHIK